MLKFSYNFSTTSKNHVNYLFQPEFHLLFQYIFPSFQYKYLYTVSLSIPRTSSLISLSAHLCLFLCSSLFLGATISKQLRASTAAACVASMGKSCHTQEEEEVEDVEEEEQVT